MKDVEERARTFLPLTEATYSILVSLAQPRHGYGIMQDVAEVSGGRVSLGPGTLYGALTNLLRQGLIERSGTFDSGEGRRKVYSLTELGRAVGTLESERLEGMAKLGRRIFKRAGGPK
jgi:DNA-binding PadR family transcriptional regulator